MRNDFNVYLDNTLLEYIPLTPRSISFFSFQAKSLQSICIFPEFKYALIFFMGWLKLEEMNQMVSF